MTTWELPPELYRFRTYAARSAAGLDKADVRDLLEGRLKFSRVTEFNDPFEGRPLAVPVHQDAGEQRAALVKYLLRIHAEREFPSGLARRRVEEFMAGKTQVELVEFMRNRLIALFTGPDVRVCCLSGPAGIRSPLPWSHYADHHRGVCVHFDSSKPPLSVAHPVTYSETYPEVSVPRTEENDNWERTERAILTKSAQWKYEDEYRMVRIDEADPRRRPDVAKLFVDWDEPYALSPPGTVRGITFGARMAEAERTDLLRMIDEMELKIEVYGAELHSSRYEIVRSRLR
jgi:Protein of unknown function (DUF2971)